MNGQNVKYNYNVITIDFAGTEVDMELLYQGKLLYYHSGSISLNVRLNSQSEDAIPLSAKEQITAPFDRLYFTPSAAGSVTLFLSNPADVKIESKQVNVDTVNLLARDDSFSYYSLQSKAYIGGAFWTPAASNYGLIELFNQAGSGKTVILQSVRPFGYYTTGQLYALAVSSQLTSPTAVPKSNKYLGGAASAVVLQRKDDTTLPTTTNYFWSDIIPAAGTSFAYDAIYPNILQRDPLILPSGRGVRVVSQVVATPFGAYFEWLEV